VLKEWTLILYGTYDDPNKHLTPETVTLERPQSSRAQPSGPGRNLAANSANQPQQSQTQTHTQTHPQASQPQIPAPVFAPADANSDLVLPKLSNHSHNNNNINNNHLINGYNQASSSNTINSGTSVSNVNINSVNNGINNSRRPMPPQQAPVLAGNQLQSPLGVGQLQQAQAPLLPPPLPPPLKAQQATANKPLNLDPQGPSSSSSTGSSTVANPSLGYSSSSSTSSHVSSYKTVMGEHDDRNNNHGQHVNISGTQSIEQQSNQSGGDPQQQQHSSNERPHLSSSSVGSSPGGQLGESGGQAIGSNSRPDFDVVAAPKSSPTETTTTTTANQWHHQQATPVAENIPTTSVATSSLSNNASDISKQLVVVQGNRLDGQDLAEQLRVGQSSSISSSSSNKKLPPQTLSTVAPPLENPEQEQIDANQLDSKLSKDYRSSGSDKKNAQHLDKESRSSSSSAIQSTTSHSSQLILIIQQVAAISGLMLLASVVV